MQSTSTTTPKPNMERERGFWDRLYYAFFEPEHEEPKVVYPEWKDDKIHQYTPEEWRAMGTPVSRAWYLVLTSSNPIEPEGLDRYKIRYGDTKDLIRVNRFENAWRLSIHHNGTEVFTIDAAHAANSYTKDEWQAQQLCRMIMDTHRENKKISEAAHKAKILSSFMRET